MDDKTLAKFRKWEESKTATGRIKFLRNIRERLFLHGAKIYDKTIITTYNYHLRFLIKDILRIK